MTHISRMRIALTGFSGGPGVMTMYVSNVANVMSDLDVWKQHMAAYMPAVVHLAIEDQGDIIEDTSGELVGSWTETAPASTTGAGDSTYAAPLGFNVTWLTDSVMDGSRVKGRTYVVPCSSALFAPSGRLLETPRAALQGFSEALVTAQAGNLITWHRPRKATLLKPYRAGGSANITSARVSGAAAILTSRRD